MNTVVKNISFMQKLYSIKKHTIKKCNPTFLKYIPVGGVAGVATEAAAAPDSASLASED